MQKLDSKPKEMELGGRGPTESRASQRGMHRNETDRILEISLGGEKRRVGMHSLNSPPLTLFSVLH